MEEFPKNFTIVFFSQFHAFQQLAIVTKYFFFFLSIHLREISQVKYSLNLITLTSFFFENKKNSFAKSLGVMMAVEFPISSHPLWLVIFPLPSPLSLPFFLFFFLAKKIVVL